MLRIYVTSVPVDDQDKALSFYTEKLGFIKKTEVPVGEYRWLTVVSPLQPDGPELLLEPMAFPPSVTFQKALFEAGIPFTSFAVADIHAEHKRLVEAGVTFQTPPTEAGEVITAVLEDTCGNLIQIVQIDD